MPNTNPEDCELINIRLPRNAYQDRATIDSIHDLIMETAHRLYYQAVAKLGLPVTTHWMDWLGQTVLSHVGPLRDDVLDSDYKLTAFLALMNAAIERREENFMVICEGANSKLNFLVRFV
jgi:hypothetical protein